MVMTPRSASLRNGSHTQPSPRRRNERPSALNSTSREASGHLSKAALMASSTIASNSGDATESALNRTVVDQLFLSVGRAPAGRLDLNRLGATRIPAGEMSDPMRSPCLRRGRRFRTKAAAIAGDAGRDSVYDGKA